MPETDAYTFVDFVLHHPKGGVEAILRQVDHHETEWCEFKAALGPQPLDTPAKKQRPEAYAWHVTKALVAMANSCGGILLLGIDDDGNAVSLENTDPRNFLEREGQDAFMRKVIEPRIFPVNGVFQIKDNTKVTVNPARLRELVSPKVARFHDQSVVAFLVKPVPAGGDLLRVVESDPEREYIPVRASGDTGDDCKLIQREEQDRWTRERSPTRPEFAAMLDGFCREHGINAPLAPAPGEVTRSALDRTITDRIVKILARTPTGLSIYDIEEDLAEDVGLDVIQDHLSALHQDGVLFLVKGHLWRLAGMFPAHPASDVMGHGENDATRWRDFRRLCHYYVDCNLASGAKGVTIWSNRENQEFIQASARIDWDTLFQGEPVYFPDSIFPESFDKKVFLGDCAAFLCGPLYCSRLGRPFLPAFINPCLVEWVKDRDLVRLLFTGPPELNDEWLNAVASNPEDRSRLMQLFSAEGSVNSTTAGWQPPRTLSQWVHDLNKILKKENVVELPCIYSLDAPTPLSQIKKPGYYNRILIVPQKAQVYTSRLQRELRIVASAKDEDLDRTALAHLFPRSASGSFKESVPPKAGMVPQLQLLSPDQRNACVLAGQKPVTVVTGPPGTGKSRVVANTMAQAFIEKRSVLFASRNHEALNAVVPYLNAFSPQVPVCGRLSQPFQENAPDPLKEILGLLFNNTVAINGETKSEIEEVSDELQGIIRQLAAKDQALMERAQQYAEADRLSTDAEDRLREMGTAADVIRAHPKKCGEKAWAENYLQAVVAPVPTGFFLMRKFLEWKRRRQITQAVKAATPSMDGLRDVWVNTFMDAYLEVLRDPVPGNEDKRAEILRHIITMADVADLYLKAQAARQELERVEALDVIEGQIATMQTELCKCTERALTTVAKSAGHNLEGAEREKIDGLRSALRSQPSPTRLQALVRRSFPMLLKYLPLWAVSNLSAGRHLPLEPGLFDLLIIDEASQCDIASVVPLLYRAKRVMVVGDRQQLRFVSGLSSAMNHKLRARYHLTDGDTIDRYDYSVNSFFDLANGSAAADLNARVLLKDHYRCHRNIADYFNRTFYGGALYVNTDENKLKKNGTMVPGICWTQVPADAKPSDMGGGAISVGQIEAICAELKRLELTKYPGTVGVVTPFRRQADRIRDAVNAQFASQPPAHWNFQCDTADGFQGGERDVILFSLVGGPDMPPSCSWFYEQDPNRFNVAVSRAKAVLRVFGDREWLLGWAKGNERRKHIEILAMIPSADDAVPPDGMPDAARPDNPSIIGDPNRIGPVWEPKLAAELWKRGLPVQQQYPACGRYLDMALIKPGLKLDIEVDGEAYHRGRDGNRKQDDIMRDIVLIANGWRIKRYWVYQLRENWDKCVQEIESLWNEGT